jgi:hypothetical protein
MNAATVGICMFKNIDLLNQKILNQQSRMLIDFYEMKSARKTIGMGLGNMGFVLTGV